MHRYLKPQLSDEPEESLVAQAQQGNPAALNELYSRYLSAVERLCARMIRDAKVEKDLLEDLLQDVYLKVYASISSMPDKTSFQTWLQQIAVDLLHDYRKKRPTSERGLDQAPSKLPTDSSHEINSIVSNAMRLIPSMEREVMILHYFKGFTLPEIADVLQCQVGSVRSLASRGRQRLRKLLQAGSEETVGSAPESTKEATSRLSPTGRDRVFQKYHRLVDKKLEGRLSRKDAQALERIEETIQLIEDKETSEIEEAMERRHRQIVQQISELTTELREFTQAVPGSKLQ